MKVEIDDLQERMSTYGLTRRRWRSRATPVLDRQAFGQQLRVFAEQSGPVFVAFVRNLGTRLDLLPLSDCMTLAAAEDHSPETPFAMLASLIEESLGSPVEDLFAVFDQEAVRRSLFTQWHTAVTIEGEGVMVEMMRPDVTRELDAKLDQLHVLSSLRAPDEHWSRLDMPRLVEDFRVDLEERLDLGEQKKALETLSSAIVDDDGLTVAEPVERLCSKQILTVKQIEGRFVDTLDLMDDQSAEAESDDVSDPDERAAEPEKRGPDQDQDIARQLCLAWLQQALFGECYPTHASGENLFVRDDGRFAVLGGGISCLTTGARNSLLDYLAAASRQDPDLAAVLLTREMTMTADASRESLRLAFRQAEPFRDGGWISDYAGPRLAHDLFVHWRLARGCGFEPLPHLVTFCRGLAELERTTRQMAPSRDALQQGLDDVRVIGAAVNVRQLFGPTHLIANLERLLPAGQEVLHRLNEISSDVNQGRVRLVELPREDRRVGSSDGNFERLAALLMVMTAVALVTPTIASLVSSARWVEPLGVAIFLMIAATLFWQIGKRSER